MNEGNDPNKTPNRRGEYAKFVKLLPKTFEELEKLLDSRNEPTKLGAINSILDRIFPKLRAVELSGGENPDGTKQPVQLLINTGRGFIPATIQFNAPSNGGNNEPSPEVQSAGVAQAGEENNDSNSRDSQAGTS